MHYHLLLLLLLLALVLFLLLPWQVALPLIVLLMIGWLIILRKVLETQRQPSVTGEKAMIGERAMVVAAKKGELEVRYHGEIWHAVCPEPLHRGQEVIIEDVESLTLYVMPVPESTEYEAPE
jgi:membrane protein implicated in regulation of membrane protease activity